MRDKFQGLLKEIQKEVLGKSTEIEMIVLALLSRGHVLIEDLPGMGKTVLAKALARVLSLKFKRIQGTSDLLASDILGVHIFNPESRKFELHEGPAFAELVLFDEMNRTPARTQSALLQVMAEHQITIDRITYHLEPPYFVIGTQNPLSSDGTFRLPDSQLDRFSIRLSLGYPSQEYEKRILKGEAESALNAMVSGPDLLLAQKESQTPLVDDKIYDYLVKIARQTREDTQLNHGVSVRALKDLICLCKSRAWLKGFDYVTPDDVQKMAVPCLSHRVSGRHLTNRFLQEEYIRELLRQVPLPL